MVNNETTGEEMSTVDTWQARKVVTCQHAGNPHHPNHYITDVAPTQQAKSDRVAVKDK
jgi:hypothetical protein